MRSERLGVYRRDDHTGIGFEGRETSVSSDNAEDFRLHLLGIFHGAYEVRTNILFEVPTAHGKNKNAIVSIQPALSQPVNKDSLPAIIVYPGGEFGNIVHRSIGLDSADLPEIIDGMGGIGRPAADSQEKNPPLFAPHLSQ